MIRSSTSADVHGNNNIDGHYDSTGKHGWPVNSHRFRSAGHLEVG